MSVEDLDLPVGSRIAGRYVIERGVRRSPYVGVYVARAETAQTARFTARVVPMSGVGTDAVGAVNRELQRVAMLRQRAVPALVAVARDGAGLVVITERPDGPTLRDLLLKSGRLKSGEIGRLVTEVAAVLDAMHTASPAVVHRALMPENIAVADRMLRVWVDECGLAQALTNARLLPEGALPAPPRYRSPGELLGRVTPQSDVFVLASIAYECLTGRPAHEGATDVDTDALVLRGPRPSVRAVRAAGAPEIDAVLHRAWSEDAGYPTASAFARELVRVLTANPSSRGMPAATARAKPESIDVGAKDPRNATLLGIASQPGSSGSSAAAGNPMKSTLLGIGVPRATQRTPGPSAPRTGAQFGPPVASPTLTESKEAPTLERPRLRRPSETTQRVEVPRIRPPGTEPVDPNTGRGKTPGPVPARMPPTTEEPVSAPAGTVPLAARTASATSPVEPGAETPPVASPPAAPSLPDAAVIVADAASAADKINLEPQVPPGERLSDQNWGEMEPSLDGGRDSTSSVPPPGVAPLSSPRLSGSVPPLPMAAPESDVLRVSDSFGVVTADTFDIVSDEDFSPVVPAPRAEATPTGFAPPPPLPVATPFPPLPAMPVIPQPVTPLGFAMTEVSIPPPLPASRPSESDMDSELLTPVPPALPDPPLPVEPVAAVIPYVEEVPVPPVLPVVPAEYSGIRPSVPAWAAPPAPPEALPSKLATSRGFRAGLVAGVSVLVATAVLGAGWAYGRYFGRRETDSQVAIVRRDTPPVPTVVPVRPATADAGEAASPVESPDATVVAAVTADATVVAAVTDAAPATVEDAALAAVEDASAQEPSAPTRLRRRPRGGDLDDLEEQLTPAIQACITDNHHRRHVHVAARYEGATGRAVEVTVSSTFAEPPIGPCIEGVIRAHPLSPFTADDYEAHLSFESH